MWQSRLSTVSFHLTYLTLVPTTPQLRLQARSVSPLTLNLCKWLCLRAKASLPSVSIPKPVFFRRFFLITLTCQELCEFSALGTPLGIWHWVIFCFMVVLVLTLLGFVCVYFLNLYIFLVSQIDLSFLRACTMLCFYFCFVLVGAHWFFFSYECVKCDDFPLDPRSRTSLMIPAAIFSLILPSQSLLRTSVGHIQNFSKDSYRHVENRPQRQI